jgi:2,4-dienoyl-CoA reductase-like NADH-dependent reductase (Old Yellow Enzyme family)
MRFLLQVATALRQTIPDDMPLFTRISATDWVEGGWDLDQSIELARALKSVGVDLIDASSGGIVPGAIVPVAPGYQVPFAAAIREKADIPQVLPFDVATNQGDAALRLLLRLRRTSPCHKPAHVTPIPGPSRRLR